MNMSFVIRRTWRVVTGKKGIYGEMGKKNHFAQGVLIYEQATIGNYNYFAPYTIVNNASIGNYCSIGPGGANRIRRTRYDRNIDAANRC